MIDPRVASLCTELGIEIVPKHVAPQPGQTRAVATIRRMIDNRGEGHARLVLTLFSECQGNKGLADEVGINAVSDVLLACPALVEYATSELLEAFDKIPLGYFMFHISELRGIVPQRPAVAGLIYFHLRKVQEIAEARQAAQRRGRAGQQSEEGKGRRWEYSPHRTLAEKVHLGRQFLDAKAKLPWGHFGPWLEQNSPVSLRTAHECMRLAREAEEVSVEMKAAA